MLHLRISSLYKFVSSLTSWDDLTSLGQYIRIKRIIENWKKKSVPMKIKHYRTAPLKQTQLIESRKPYNN